MWPTPKTYRFTGEPPTSGPLNNSNRGDPPLSSGIRAESLRGRLGRFPNLISFRGPEMSRFSSVSEMLKKKKNVSPTRIICHSPSEHRRDMRLTDSGRADSPLSFDIKHESIGRRLDQFRNTIRVIFHSNGVKFHSCYGVCSVTTRM